MKLNIDFPGGTRVDAHFGPFTVATDQPPDASAPSPFAMFLASIGTCAGIYVLGFCQQRGLPTEGLRITETTHAAADGMVGRIDLEVELPADFPDKYRDAVVRAAEQCTVKKHLERPPSINVTAHHSASMAPVEL
jgi:ribosomal protein S12 methylthiotransferase accessory factor